MCSSLIQALLSCFHHTEAKQAATVIQSEQAGQPYAQRRRIMPLWVKVVVGATKGFWLENTQATFDELKPLGFSLSESFLW